MSATARRRRSAPRWTRRWRARSGTPARHGCGRRRRDARGSAARASWSARAATLPADRSARPIAGDERVESDATERRARRDEIPRHVVTEIASNEHDRGRCRPRTERAARCRDMPLRHASAKRTLQSRQAPDLARARAAASAERARDTARSRPGSSDARGAATATPSPFQTPAGTRSVSRPASCACPGGTTA